MEGSINVERLEQAVKSVYRDVAAAPNEEYHFEMGRKLAERLGYPASDLDRISAQALESFAGVGYHFDLADLHERDDVFDLGSGSGMDVFVAALQVGNSGSVTGLDMTDQQLTKSRQLRDEAGMDNVPFERGYIEDTPFDDGAFDVAISNRVINLSLDKQQVFEEANRVLASGGRLAISDIISEKLMPESIKDNEDLWAACIGGAEWVNRYTSIIEDTGFEVTDVRENTQYEFISDQANACQKYGVKSISLSVHR